MKYLELGANVLKDLLIGKPRLTVYQALRSQWSDGSIPSLVVEDHQGTNEVYVHSEEERWRITYQQLWIAALRNFAILGDSRGPRKENGLKQSLLKKDPLAQYHFAQLALQLGVRTQRVKNRLDADPRREALRSCLQQIYQPRTEKDMEGLLEVALSRLPCHKGPDQVNIAQQNGLNEQVGMERRSGVPFERDYILGRSVLFLPIIGSVRFGLRQECLSSASLKSPDTELSTLINLYNVSDPMVLDNIDEPGRCRDGGSDATVPEALSHTPELPAKKPLFNQEIAHSMATRILSESSAIKIDTDKDQVTGVHEDDQELVPFNPNHSADDCTPSSPVAIDVPMTEVSQPSRDTVLFSEHRRSPLWDPKLPPSRLFANNDIVMQGRISRKRRQKRRNASYDESLILHSFMQESRSPLLIQSGQEVEASNTHSKVSNSNGARAADPTSSQHLRTLQDKKEEEEEEDGDMEEIDRAFSLPSSQMRSVVSINSDLLTNIPISERSAGKNFAVPRQVLGANSYVPGREISLELPTEHPRSALLTNTMQVKSLEPRRNSETDLFQPTIADEVADPVSPLIEAHVNDQQSPSASTLSDSHIRPRMDDDSLFLDENRLLLLGSPEISSMADYQRIGDSDAGLVSPSTVEKPRHLPQAIDQDISAASSSSEEHPQIVKLDIRHPGDIQAPGQLETLLLVLSTARTSLYEWNGMKLKSIKIDRQIPAYFIKREGWTLFKHEGTVKSIWEDQKFAHFLMYAGQYTMVRDDYQEAWVNEGHRLLRAFHDHNEERHDLMSDSTTKTAPAGQKELTIETGYFSDPETLKELASDSSSHGDSIQNNFPAKSGEEHRLSTPNERGRDQSEGMSTLTSTARLASTNNEVVAKGRSERGSRL